MKKLTFIAGICIIATGILASCGGKATDKEENNNEQEAVETKEVSNTNAKGHELKIAYVLLDTLQNQYQFFKDVNDELEKKAKAAESQVKQAENKVVQLQNQIQKKVQSNQYTTEEQYTADQRALQQLYEKGQQLQNRLTLEIQTETGKRLQEVSDTIKNFMDNYAKKKGYDFVFSKTAGIDHLIYAAPSYDITNEVVAALNKRYKKKAGK